jgi:hypothetical protein
MRAPTERLRVRLTRLARVRLLTNRNSITLAHDDSLLSLTGLIFGRNGVCCPAIIAKRETIASF